MFSFFKSLKERIFSEGFTSERAVDVICGCLSPGQLDLLKIEHRIKTLTFREQLLTFYSDKRPKYDEGRTREWAEDSIKQYEKIIEMAPQENYYELIIGIFGNLFV